jgi:hypothetical protein
MISSSMNLGFEAPPDAYAVAHAVAVQGPMARAIYQYALMGPDAHPDWTPHPVILVERGKTGQTMHIAPGGKRHLAPFRMVRFVGDLPAIVEERRRGYGDWARAVRAVHRWLSDRGLSGHALSAEQPALAPWDGPRKSG